jgi:serine protease
MNRRLRNLIAATLPASLAAAAWLGLPAGAAAATGISPARAFVPHQVVVKLEGERAARTVTLPAGNGVRRTAARLRSDPRVAYAAPNYIATASATPPELPNDPGALGATTAVAGGWVTKQWSFLPWQGPATEALPVSPGGIDVVGAWANLADAGRPGGEGVTVAVLDTGVAYRGFRGRFRRSPDFAARQFVPGRDFVDGDRLPLDRNGHGTHVAGTIAEKTNNGIGLTGIAYRARLMPVRVLDRNGRGQADDIARGIRFATAHGADVINMSFNFGCRRRVPSVNEALRRAHRRGVVAVASIGNLGSESCVSPPATGPHVIGVGGTTEGGCLGDYSLTGRKVDLLAPGGGSPVAGCPSVSARPIFQVTLKGRNPRRFGEPGEYVGTSMAAAHVSAVAALAIASRALGNRPKPDHVRRRLRRTARELGLPARKQGAGLIDAALATQPGPRQALRRFR